MAETIRERIERANRNLIPASEVDARIEAAVAEAVKEERERAAQIIETIPLPGHLVKNRDAIAAAIRKEPDHDN